MDINQQITELFLKSLPIEISYLLSIAKLPNYIGLVNRFFVI